MCDNNGTRGACYSADCPCCRPPKRANVDPLRRTGRTSRTIERALCGLVMGKQVLLVMHNQQACASAIVYATEWLHRNGWTDQQQVPLSVESSNKVILFGTGKLRVLSMEANLQGLRPELTLEDHHATELKAEAERKRQRMEDCGEIIRLMQKHGFTRLNITDEQQPVWVRR